MVSRYDEYGPVQSPTSIKPLSIIDTMINWSSCTACRAYIGSMFRASFGGFSDMECAVRLVAGMTCGDLKQG